MRLSTVFRQSQIDTHGLVIAGVDRRDSNLLVRGKERRENNPNNASLQSADPAGASTAVTLQQKSQENPTPSANLPAASNDAKASATTSQFSALSVLAATSTNTLSPPSSLSSIASSVLTSVPEVVNTTPSSAPSSTPVIIPTSGIPTSSITSSTVLSVPTSASGTSSSSVPSSAPAVTSSDIPTSSSTVSSAPTSTSDTASSSVPSSAPAIISSDIPTSSSTVLSVPTSTSDTASSSVPSSTPVTISSDIPTSSVISSTVSSVPTSTPDTTSSSVPSSAPAVTSSDIPTSSSTVSSAPTSTSDTASSSVPSSAPAIISSDIPTSSLIVSSAPTSTSDIASSSAPSSSPVSDVVVAASSPTSAPSISGVAAPSVASSTPAAPVTNPASPEEPDSTSSSPASLSSIDGTPFPSQASASAKGTSILAIPGQATRSPGVNTETKPTSSSSASRINTSSIKSNPATTSDATPKSLNAVSPKETSSKSDPLLSGSIVAGSQTRIPVSAIPTFNTAFIPLAAQESAGTVTNTARLPGQTNLIGGTGGSSTLTVTKTNGPLHTTGGLASVVIGSTVGGLAFLAIVFFIIRRLFRKRRLTGAEFPPASPLLQTYFSDPTLPAGIARSMSQNTGASSDPFWAKGHGSSDSGGSFGAMLNGGGYSSEAYQTQNIGFTHNNYYNNTSRIMTERELDERFVLDNGIAPLSPLPPVRQQDPVAGANRPISKHRSLSLFPLVAQ